MWKRQHLLYLHSSKNMHTRSFTILYFPKIGLTHKNFPSGVANYRNLPFCRRARRDSRVRLPKEENAQSRHQRLFVENVGKTEGNRSWRIFQIRELYLRLRKVLTPLTFVSKDNNLIFRIVWNCVTLTFISFLFLRSKKAGLLLLRTLHRRRN